MTETSPTTASATSPSANQASQDREEEEGGFMGKLGKLAKNNMSPYLLMGLVAAGVLFGAPTWMIVAGGLLGWFAIAAGRNSENSNKPADSSDVTIGGATVKPQGRGLGLEQNHDVTLGGAAVTPPNLDVTLVGNSATHDVTLNTVPPLTNAVPPPTLPTNTPNSINNLNNVQLNGVQCNAIPANNDVTLSLVPSQSPCKLPTQSNLMVGG